MTPYEATQQGLAAQRAGRLAEAESHYAMALKHKPDLPLALEMMGMLALGRRDFPATEEWFGRAIAAAAPNSAGGAFTGRGEIFLRRALANFAQALRLDPERRAPESFLVPA